MNLPDEYLEKFRAIYLKKHGKELGHQEALEQSTKLINLFELMLKNPVTDEQLKDYWQDRYRRLPQIMAALAERESMDD